VNFTSNPTFRTINQSLKRALNTLEDESKPWPALTFAEIVNQRIVASRDLSALVPSEAASFVAASLTDVRVFGFSMTAFSVRKMTASVYLDHASDDAAKSAAKNQLLPLLNLAKLLGKVPLDVNDYTSGQQPGGYPGGGYPGGEGGGYPGGEGGGYPGGYPGGPGGSQGPPPPPSGGSLGPAPGGKRASSSRYGDDELAQKPGMPGPGGSQGPPPGGGYPGEPGMPGPGYPGMPGPGYPGGNPTPGQPSNGSKVDVKLSGTVVTLDFDLLWDGETYNSVVAPKLTRTASQFRGRMAVSSGEIDAFTLGAAVANYTKRTKEFPRGTLDRDAGGDRFGLAYPPGERVSFLAELLPFVGKANLHDRIQQSRRFAWYADENLSAAEEWVPEFLNPSYPQDSWRATSDLAKGRVLGATNYVGIAGLGLDAARYDPKDPAVAKKIGLISYDDGAKANLTDCADGLSNTMLMVQLPPTSPRPWIAGGGSTLTGIEDSDDAFKPYVTRQPDGSRGAMVLMGDGSVRFVREGTAPAVFKAMATRAGGDSLPDFDRLVPKMTPARQMTPELRPVEPVKTDPAPVKNEPKPEPKAGAIDADELKKLQGSGK